MDNRTPKFPIYIPSKGRYESLITSRYLDSMGVHHRLVVEPQEYKLYLNAIGDKSKLLVLDMSYKENYDLCDDYGLSRSTGSGPARNFIWDHSIAEGHSHHWIMDDNIKSFRRYNKNQRIKVSNGSMFVAMEDFFLRYKNLAMAGPNYYMFIAPRAKVKPLIFNTRIYSCNLIRNDVPFRWRGRYNEDTILSLDMLKAGWCTVLFNAFLQRKMTTQTVKGGNTEELYGNGTTEKSQMLVNMHPDVARLAFKFNRVHHHVDYNPFKTNRLLKHDDAVINEQPNEYGFNLKMTNRAKS
jgi:hypothetical protein